MLHEQLLSFAEASKTLPANPTVQTLHRWRLRGVRGVKLETVMIGGRRMTSVEALERFVERTSSASYPEPFLVRKSRDRQALMNAAAKTLAAGGV